VGVWPVRPQLDAATGQNRGYGFVAFRTREHAAAAIKELNGTPPRGERLRARPTPNKPSSACLTPTVFARQWKAEEEFHGSSPHQRAGQKQ
jgi:RNA recognition motif-containing protein